LKTIPGALDFAIVGTWDNESGKGYDLELPPELRSGLDQKYSGRSHDLVWRITPRSTRAGGSTSAR